MLIQVGQVTVFGSNPTYLQNSIVSSLFWLFLVNLCKFTGLSIIKSIFEMKLYVVTTSMS